MAKSPKKKKPAAKPKAKPDFAQNAFRIVQEATGQAPKTPDPDAGKDPAAVARGTSGGLIGGVARAKKLPPEVRKAIAQRAAAARWGKKKPPPKP